jgi:SPP1 gp7 family putative phage head morphogenesis protein
MRLLKADDLWTPPDGPSRDFAQQVTPIIRAQFRAGAEAAVDDYELGIDYDFADPAAIEYARERGAEMVGRQRDAAGNLVDHPSAFWSIEETTRTEINELLQQAISEGWSVSEFKRYLDGSGEFEPWRAEMIARTEMAMAQNGGRLAAFREAGNEYVVCSDEATCGEAICEDVDGEIFSIDEAAEILTGHPNCTRSFRPATKAEVEEFEGTEEADEEGAA